MTIRKSGLTIVVTTAAVDFLESNAVSIVADADVSGYGVSGSATANVSSGLRYEDGDFYLADLYIGDVDFSLDEESSSRVDDVKSVAEGFFKAARDRIEESNPGSGDSLDALRADVMGKIEPAFRNAVDTALGRIPVYTLNGRDLKYDLAAIALEDVGFSDLSAHATLNPGQAVLRIVIGAITIVTALLIGIVFVFGSLGGLRRNG